MPALVPGPDWLRLQVALDGKPLTMLTGALLEHRRTLDMRRGLVISSWRHRSAAGHALRLRNLRLVSLADRAIGLQVVELAAEEAASEITWKLCSRPRALGWSPSISHLS